MYLSAWVEQPQTSIAATAKHLGLSQQRVRNAQQWAYLGNLLNFQGLTSIGSLALEKDPYLEATVTDWIIHFYCSLNGLSMSENSTDWGIWAYIVYDFLKTNSMFDQESLSRALSQKFAIQKAEDIAKVFLKTYSQKESLANCSFLRMDENSYATGSANLRNAYTVGYLLSVIWQRDFFNQDSVLVDNIVNTSVGLSSVLGISESQLREQLDNLAKIEVIEQRSAKPRSADQKAYRREDDEDFYLVVRCWETPLDLLVEAYEKDPAVPNRSLAQVLGETFGDDEDDLPFFLSFSQNLLSSFCPQQFQLFTESAPFNPPLHLAS